MSRCWAIILLGDQRQYAGNTGYQDQAEQFYEYDTNVANHKQVSVGDVILLRDTESAFAISKIESIEKENAVKEHLRCPKCAKTGIKTRTTKQLKYRCWHCKYKFDEPDTTRDPITRFRAHYSVGSYFHLLPKIPKQLLKTAALRANDQASIEEIDPSSIDWTPQAQSDQITSLLSLAELGRTNTWTEPLAQQLRDELTPEASSIIDFLATHPDQKFTAQELVLEFSLPNEYSLRAFLGKTTIAAKRIGVSQEELHSWFVLWEELPRWKYWLDNKRAAWWNATAKWPEEELKAAIESYCEMVIDHRSHREHKATNHARALSKRFSRKENAYEWQFKNISYLFELLGRSWLPSLAPARYANPDHIRELEQTLTEFEGIGNTEEASHEASVRVAQRTQSSSQPDGNEHPKTKPIASTDYQRDPKVHGWVLRHADGKCESCGNDAPFLRTDERPYLEVHHVCPLAEGGPDTVKNAVAVCPNCHRALHFALDRDKLLQSLYDSIGRLKPT